MARRLLLTNLTLPVSPPKLPPHTTTHSHNGHAVEGGGVSSPPGRSAGRGRKSMEIGPDLPFHQLAHPTTHTHTVGARVREMNSFCGVVQIVAAAFATARAAPSAPVCARWKWNGVARLSGTAWMMMTLMLARITGGVYVCRFRSLLTALVVSGSDKHAQRVLSVSHHAPPLKMICVSGFSFRAVFFMFVCATSRQNGKAFWHFFAIYACRLVCIIIF